MLCFVFFKFCFLSCLTKRLTCVDDIFVKYIGKIGTIFTGIGQNIVPCNVQKLPEWTCLGNNWNVLFMFPLNQQAQMSCLISKLQGKWINNYRKRRREGGERRKNLFCFLSFLCCKKREREKRKKITFSPTKAHSFPHLKLKRRCNLRNRKVDYVVLTLLWPVSTEVFNLL